MIKIRQAETSDLREVAQINIDNWQRTYENILPKSFLDQLTLTDKLEKWQQFYSENTHIMLIAESDNQVAGFIAVSIDSQMSNALYVDALHVSNHFQRKGVGTKLLIEILDRAKKNQQLVTIAILKENENARNLYIKLGAVHLKNFTDYFGDVVTRSERLIWR